MKDRLKIARDDKDFSQTKLAELIGVSQGLIQSLESGRVQSTTFIWEICLTLGISPTWLLRGEGPKELDLAIIETKYSVITLPFLRIEEIKNWLDHDILPQDCRRITMLNNNAGLGSKSFFYEIQGDAMVSTEEPPKSLFAGELAIIDPSVIPESGDIVLAQTSDGNFKVRQYLLDGSQAILKAHNDSYKKIEESFIVLGVIVFTQKKLKELKLLP